MKPGDEIICINASKMENRDYSEFTNWVVEGAKYTIRRVENYPFGPGKRLLLEELKNPLGHFDSLGGKTELGFHSSRFANYEDYVLGKVEVKEEKFHLN